MKVLWLSPTVGKYFGPDAITGGWVASLQNEIEKYHAIELGIIFKTNKCLEKRKDEKTNYYPINFENNQGLFLKLKNKYFPNTKKSENREIEIILKIIEEFKPDLIHIFGSENSYGNIINYTNLPVVIHLQGILSPYINAWFPPGISSIDLWKFQNVLNIILKKDYISKLKRFKSATKRERRILNNVKYVYGRTDWDKRISSIYAPKAKYIHCDEILREVFYNNEVIVNSKPNKIRILSTIAPQIYKGLDLILKTANILKNNLHIDFQWDICGIDSSSDLVNIFEKKFKIRYTEVGCTFHGLQKPNQILDIMLNSDIFIHPSYIDNSPNSVCEAQIVGLPVIAVNVGGVSSLVPEGTGVLIPANDPYTLAVEIQNLRNYKKRVYISEKAKQLAKNRHNKENIVNRLIQSYTNIINEYYG